jgi:hypothetical protein
LITQSKSKFDNKTGACANAMLNGLQNPDLILLGAKKASNSESPVEIWYDTQQSTMFTLSKQKGCPHHYFYAILKLNLDLSKLCVCVEQARSIR